MNRDADYLSLQEATKYSNYSQEYLSLRARQGKLKSVKVGRNWVTKREWLDEYLKKTQEYNKKVQIKKGRAKKITVPVVAKKREVFPPLNLPIGDPEEKKSLGWLIRREPEPQEQSQNSFQIRRVFVLVFILIIISTGLIFGSDFYTNPFSLIASLPRFYSELNNSPGKFIEEFFSSNNAVYLLDTFGDYARWLGKETNKIDRKSAV